MGKIVKIIGVFVSLVLLAGAVGVAMLAFPMFGNHALIVRSGSMEPSIGVGSVVVVKGEERTYDVGDVISFRMDENTIVTHRVTEVITEEGVVSYKTKGDANEEEDNWTVASSDVLGKSQFVIPEFGKLLSFARSKYGFPLLIIGPAGIVILVEIVNIIREIRKNKTQVSGNRFRFVMLKSFIPFLLLAFTVQHTSAFFSDTETSRGNFFQAAATFPTQPPTPTPTSDPDDGGPCGDIEVDISGNGVGSHNGVVIVCENHEVVEQYNETNVENEINVESNTGNNSSSGSTSSTTVIQSGSSTSSTTVVNSSSSNTTVNN